MTLEQPLRTAKQRLVRRRNPVATVLASHDIGGTLFWHATRGLLQRFTHANTTAAGVAPRGSRCRAPKSAGDKHLTLGQTVAQHAVHFPCPRRRIMTIEPAQDPPCQWAFFAYHLQGVGELAVAAYRLAARIDRMLPELFG